jgi:hypothetical protein
VFTPESSLLYPHFCISLHLCVPLPSLVSPPNSLAPGAKTGKREDHGELFGMLNMLRFNTEHILTLDLLKAERRRRAQLVAPRVVDLDIEAVAAAAPAAAAAQSQGQAARDGSAGLEYVSDGDDPGLQVRWWQVAGREEAESRRQMGGL